LRHPKELSLDFLDGMLFQVGQHEEEFVSHRRSGTGVIRTIAAAGAGLPIDGVVLPIDHIRVLEMRQECREFSLS
jgi:hypothetical protein